MKYVNKERILLFALFLPLATVARATTPEEELCSYAKQVGAKWDAESGLLFGGKRGLDFEGLRRLSPAALLLIDTVIVAKEPATPDVRLSIAPNLSFLPRLRRLVLEGIALERADALAGMRIQDLELSGNPLAEVRFIETLRDVEVIGLLWYQDHRTARSLRPSKAPISWRCRDTDQESGRD